MRRKYFVVLISYFCFASFLVGCLKKENDNKEIVEEVVEETEEVVVEETEEKKEENTREETEEETKKENAVYDSYNGLLFETTDINGNIINQDIFKNHKVTVVNCWTTWCGYCVNEMPYLQEIYDELSSESVQIVTVLCDSYSIDSYESDEAKTIFNDLEVSLPILISNESTDAVFPVNEGYPTSYFFDENGNVLEYVIGAMEKEDYIAIIEKYFD